MCIRDRATTAEDVETARDRAALAAAKITVESGSSSGGDQVDAQPVTAAGSPVSDIEVIEVPEPVVDVDPKLTRSADD